MIVFRYEIISKKGPRVISGIQKVNAGRIEYDDDLPEETRISKGLKLLLRPVLQELLETNEEENVITFDQFYQRVEDISSRKVSNVSLRFMTPLLFMFILSIDVLFNQFSKWIYIMYIVAIDENLKHNSLFVRQKCK